MAGRWLGLAWTVDVRRNGTVHWTATTDSDSPKSPRSDRAGLGRPTRFRSFPDIRLCHSLDSGAFELRRRLLEWDEYRYLHKRLWLLLCDSTWEGKDWLLVLKLARAKQLVPQIGCDNDLNDDHLCIAPSLPQRH